MCTENNDLSILSQSQRFNNKYKYIFISTVFHYSMIHLLNRSLGSYQKTSGPKKKAKEFRSTKK